jgi:bifunctional UDP-N-acetylglucosamine pyrophosphorylase/glucosamine-1-phosphate N-acetyltransferase/UDP-N-acetylglucosamine pyrophosphorylase
MSNRLAIVLAAGKGTRMEMDIPKVLVPACGRPLVDYVLDAVESAGIDKSIVVVGYKADQVKAALSDRSNVSFALQSEQKGTGHAVQMCRDQLANFQGAVLVVTGDSPLTQTSSLTELLSLFEKEQPACAMGTLLCDDPTGLGRIVRDDDGQFVAIVEDKDASDEQKQINEVNMSTYIFDCEKLLPALDQLQDNNSQGELYITDVPGILKSAGHEVMALACLKPCEALSINNLAQLKVAEEEMRKQQCKS